MIDTKVYELEIPARLGTARLTILHDRLTETLPWESIIRIRVSVFRPPGSQFLGRMDFPGPGFHAFLKERSLTADDPKMAVLSHTKCLQLFCKSQFPHKFVKSSFIIAKLKNKLTNFCKNRLLQNDFKHFLWDEVVLEVQQGYLRSSPLPFCP